MGFLGKLMFWKKKDEFENIGLGEKPAAPGFDLGLGSELDPGADLGAGMQTPGMQPRQGMSPQQTSFQQPSQMQPPSFGPPPSPAPMQAPGDYAANKNLEVISSKLDALRAGIESINQRLANLEAIARGEEDQRYKRRW